MYFWEIQSNADPLLVVMDLQPERFPEKKLKARERVTGSWKLKAKPISIANGFFS